VRLWTNAARALWAEVGAEPPADDTGGLLLRTEDVAPPGSGSTTGPLLDWLDWTQLAGSPVASDLVLSLTLFPRRVLKLSRSEVRAFSHTGHSGGAMLGDGIRREGSGEGVRAGERGWWVGVGCSA
jgi:hypothetical protein